MWYIAGMPIVPRLYALVVNEFLWTILALLFIVMRLYTRGIIVKRLGWDDWLMTAAMFFSICYFISTMFQIKYGLGKPVDLATLIPFLQALFSTVPLYNITQTLYKLSITAQSYRLFTATTSRQIMQFLMFWIIACGVMSVCGSLFYCYPVAKSWDDSIPGHCLNRPAINYSVSGFFILNDLALLVIPIPFLATLQVAKKQRVVLMSVFACGALITIVSIIRLKALYTNLSGPVELQPITGVDIALWSNVEINVAIICGSVPALKAFVSKVILGRSNNDSSSNDYAKNISSRMQSQRLQSRVGDEETKEPAKIQITQTVDQSIEMKSFVFDDGEGSETDLIMTDVYSPNSRNPTKSKAVPVSHLSPVSPV